MIGSPGPANMLLVASGLKFGFRRSLPFVIGIIVSKQFIIWPIALGVVNLSNASDFLYVLMKYIAAAYILYLAVKMYNIKIVSSSAKEAPPTFFQGLIVHPLNPKAWIMVVMAWGSFAPALGDFSLQLPVVILSFAACQLVFHSLWCALGAYLGKSFAYDQRLAKLMIILTIIVVLAALFYAPPA